jgi:dihydroneopterin aldolase
MTVNDPDPSSVDLTRASNGVRHVFIRDLCVDALVGVYRHEKEARQPIRINVDLAVADPGPVRDDQLKNVVNYAEVVERIDVVLAAGHVNLIETLAEKIADDCLADARVLAARVKVEKLKVIPRAASVGVEIERRRPGVSNEISLS